MKKCFLMFSLTLPCALWMIPFCHQFPAAEPGTSLCVPSSGAAESREVTFRLDSPGALSPSSQQCLQSCHSFGDLLWMLSRTLTSLLCCGTQNCTQYSRWSFTSAKYIGRITTYEQPAMLCVMHLKVWFALMAVRARCWPPPVGNSWSSPWAPGPVNMSLFPSVPRGPQPLVFSFWSGNL